MVEILATFVAIVIGVAIAVAVFAGPAWILGDNFMQSWGWFGWIPALWLAHQGAGYARSIVRKNFDQHRTIT